jgi:hypothetical protein
MRMSRHGNLLILLAVSPTLFSQIADSQVKSQDRSGVLDARQIVDLSIAATQRHWQARLHYTYVERSESRRRDLAGQVKSEDLGVTRTILVDDVPFEQLVERNGHPPSAEEERKQREDLDTSKSRDWIVLSVGSSAQVEGRAPRAAGRATAQAG